MIEIEKRKGIKRTSWEAYKRILESGNLSKMRKAVYRIVGSYGPVTGAEVDFIGSKLVDRRGHLHKRLSELERLGIAKIVGVRVCRVTGNNAEEWDITDYVPDSFVLEKKATRVELISILRRALKLLEDGLQPRGSKELREAIVEVLEKEDQ